MASAHARGQTLGVTCSIQGVQLQAGTQVFLGLANELVLCVLAEAQRIQGVPCAAGLVHFHPDANLAQATLSRDHTERGVPFAAGTLLSWNEDGTLGALLRRPQVFAGIAMPSDATVRFDGQGMLVSWSMRNADGGLVGNLPCEPGTIVTFHATGDVERMTLAESVEVGPIVALGGTDIEFHPTGAVAVATLGRSWAFSGFEFEVGTNLTFRPDGTLSVAIVAEEHAAHGQIFPEGAQLYFDERGELSGSAALTWEVLRPARS
jgi:hypothetical protein